MISWISDKFLIIEKRFPITPYIYSLIANAAIGVMQCATKLLAPTMPTNLILYVRALILIVLNTIVLRISGGEVYVKKS